MPDHIVVFGNGCATGGVQLDLPLSLPNALSRINECLGLDAKILYNCRGKVISDMSVLASGDIVYASFGEPFVTPQLVTPQHKFEADMMSESKTADNDWITLNVGGRKFTTSKVTLTTKEPDSMLARMFSSPWKSKTDAKGAFLIDRSPTYFEPILNYLRSGELIIDNGLNCRGVLAEAKFYGINSVVEQLEARIQAEQPRTENTPFDRSFLVSRLIGTPPDWELRCQGINFEGANLSKLDLRHINFKYAILRRTNLTSANLSFCNFERADLSGAKLDTANLLGVKMLCANLEGASMLACNFEDPAGSRANMEGANMKHVNLEGSHMAGVNLRVATLKNANLQNCDLRGAVLAGADLENCDLSGCDLQEANLRGANLKGAAFELMLNPVHMSQTVR